MSFSLTSPAFVHNTMMPAQQTCEGKNISPPLAWSAPPAGTKSLALIVDDPDAPDPAAPKMVWVHWVLYNLPPVAGSLPEGVADAELAFPVRERLVLHAAPSLPALYNRVQAVLHRSLDELPEDKRRMVEDLHFSGGVLANRKALIVDDDMRNIFALASVLEEHGMRQVWADNGRDAIKMLLGETTIDIVLMDIMMPEMDGMETMREIRKVARLKDLPIVAVTAKAMKGDREKCIEAGAWDYLSKPVDTGQLLSVRGAWLRRRDAAHHE